MVQIIAGKKGKGKTKHLLDMSKDAEVIAQKMTDEYGKKADEYFAKKEKDIMTI